jgi:hypothetical protein
MVRPGFGLVTPPSQLAPGTRTLRPGGSGRRHFRIESSPGRLSDEPRYGVLFGLTAGWYAIPTIVYLLWLVTIGNDRPGAAGLGSSLPWLLASLLLSLVVAGLLRWAIVGWRAPTLSFAAAVIGAGVATIAHSLSL